MMYAKSESDSKLEQANDAGAQVKGRVKQYLFSLLEADLSPMYFLEIKDTVLIEN